MAKNGKTYSITEAQLEDMIKKASEAGAEAYKKEQSQSARRKVDRIEYMHWWKFRAMFNSLTNQNEFVKIMEYRSIEIKSDMPKEQQSFYRKMKRLYALPNPGNEDEKLAEIEKALLKGGDLRGVL